MNSNEYHIVPHDLLFMRDARPMTASDAGFGSNWPRPDQVFSALINAFHRKWPETQSWEYNRYEGTRSSGRFGGLTTAGPFPFETTSGTVFFPCPLDLSADEKGELHPMSIARSSGTNLPEPLTHVFHAVKRGKHTAPEWLCIEDYRHYLRGEPFTPGRGGTVRH